MAATVSLIDGRQALVVSGRRPSGALSIGRRLAFAAADAGPVVRRGRSHVTRAAGAKPADLPRRLVGFVRMRAGALGGIVRWSCR
jgi:hypothetical protein